MAHANRPQCAHRSRTVACLVASLMVLQFLAGPRVSLAQDRFSGLAFLNWSLDTAQLPDSSYNEFALSRLYFIFQTQIAEGLTVKLTTDVSRSGSTLSVFQKIAALYWETSLGEWIFGLQGMNLWNVSEATWGYRFVEKSPMDRYGFASSADIGLGFKRNVGQHLRLHATLTNGPGYRRAEDDHFKRFTAQLLYGPNKLNRTHGFNAGAALSLEPAEVFAALDGPATANQAPLTEIQPLFSLFVGLSSAAFRVGAEFDRYTAASLSPQQIITAYGNLLLRPRLALFGRVDFYDAQADANGENDLEIYLIIGLNLAAGESFFLAPNLRLGNAPGSPLAEIGISSVHVDLTFNH